MAKRSCALIGPGVGPKVQVGVPSRVTLRGGSAGEPVIINRFHDDGTDSSMHHADAADLEVLLEECAYLQVEYRGASKSFIACVLMGA